MLVGRRAAQIGAAERSIADLGNDTLTDWVALTAGNPEDSDAKSTANDDDTTLQRLLVIEGLKHSWQDIAFHNELRNIHIRFFLLIFAALMAGFGNAYINGLALFAVAASLLGCLVSMIFLYMDIRDVEHINIGFVAVARLQKILSDWLKMPEIRMAEKSRSVIGEIVRGIGLRWILSPIRLLIVLSFVSAFCAMIASIKIVHDKICQPMPDNLLQSEKNFCRQTKDYANWMDRTHLFTMADPSGRGTVVVIQSAEKAPISDADKRPTSSAH